MTDISNTNWWYENVLQTHSICTYDYFLMPPSHWTKNKNISSESDLERRVIFVKKFYHIIPKIPVVQNFYIFHEFSSTIDQILIATQNTYIWRDFTSTRYYHANVMWNVWVRQVTSYFCILSSFDNILNWNSVYLTLFLHIFYYFLCQFV